MAADVKSAVPVLSSDNKFLILGSQRSGTTLLGMMLEAHPKIDLVEENDPAFHPRYALTRQLLLNKVKESRTHDSSLLGFKCPRDTHRVWQIMRELPGIRMLWMKRDVRQVVASMLSLHLKPDRPSWAQTFASREVMKYLYSRDDAQCLADQLQNILQDPDPRSQVVSCAALCWFVKDRARLDALEQHAQYSLSIDYDQLVLSPREQMERVLDFLGCEFHEQVLEHNKVVSGRRPGGSRGERELDARSLEKWQQTLSDNDLALIEAVVQRCVVDP